MITTTVDDVQVTADEDTGAVSTMSDWLRADALVRAGKLARRDYGAGTYGAAVYYLRMPAWRRRALAGDGSGARDLTGQVRA